MAQINVKERQLTLKVVYCGPPLAGKTTNLTKLHELVGASNRGRLMTLDGSNDRTLFFDLLPIFFDVSSLCVRIKVYTVPGQAAHLMTRRAVLRGADGVVFVADSEEGQSANNQAAFDELQASVRLLGLEPDRLALVTQYNKQDLSSASTGAAFAGEEVHRATASEGQGVVETFIAILEQAWRSVERNSKIEASFGVTSAEFSRELGFHLIKS